LTGNKGAAYDVYGKEGGAVKTLFIVASLTGLSLLFGCAPAPLTKADVDGRIVCNADQMDQVERAAVRNNRQVHWVNCPRAVLRAG
jgi:hypothetical protein